MQPSQFGDFQVYFICKHVSPPEVEKKLPELKCRGAKVKRLSGHDNVLMLQWVSNE